MTRTSAGTRFGTDRGLVGRMLATMFLLGLLYVVFVGVLVVMLGRAWPLAVVLIGGVFVAQFWFSDKLAAFAMGAREVTPEEQPELHGAVDRLCALADMPKPRVAVADSDVPNAFATGRNRRNTVVCTTTGLLRRLEPAELDGVLAHELSHVAHKDVAVMTIASFLGVLAGLLTRVGVQFGLFGGMRRDQNTAVLMLVVTAVSVVVYTLSFVLIRTLSRYRELCADRSAALLTGRPSALASALTKISGTMARIPTRDLRRAEPFNAFFFAPAIASKDSLANLFATHPTLERRLEQLGRISAELGGAA
ncbi:zinc metalloprotease HtpX [Embleya sp. NBC_00888]|uniref:zinc metalloprotease HtpX n=1 Tax=Embleya sp. NBC_00888 TaxID=2975960 RepID=UPI00386FAC7C|nr:zinc metalloprotease HtpX [Embleya sp. NBC_00888]